MTIKAGIDEAGRGAVVGPMTITIAEAQEYNLKKFCYYNEVDDSKRINRKKRDTIAEVAIHSSNIDAKTLCVLPKAIDDGNINKLTTDYTKILIQNSNADQFFIDKMSDLPQKPHITVESKADQNYKITGLASIIAKYFRDRAIDMISDNANIKLGSGYPSDSRTTENVGKLVENNNPTVRYSWSTIANI